MRNWVNLVKGNVFHIRNYDTVTGLDIVNERNYSGNWNGLYHMWYKNTIKLSLILESLYPLIDII